MFGLGFLRERKARAVVSNTLPALPEGIQLLSPVDRSATLAIVNGMIDVAVDRWGTEVAKGPNGMVRTTVVEVVLSLARSHAEITKRVLEPNQSRNMGDVLFAQAMREVRARELLIGTLGASLVVGRKPGVGQAWKLLWNARERAPEAAASLINFSRHAKVDAVPRCRARPKLATEADLLRLSATLPGFMSQRPPPVAASGGRKAADGTAPNRSGAAKTVPGKPSAAKAPASKPGAPKRPSSQPSAKAPAKSSGTTKGSHRR